jgi:hypothetical protein
VRICREEARRRESVIVVPSESRREERIPARRREHAAALGLVRFSNFASRPVPVPGLDQVDPGVTLKPGQIHPSLGFKTGN